MKMKVAKIFAQIVCYVDRSDAVPLDELKGTCCVLTSSVPQANQLWMKVRE